MKEIGTTITGQRAYPTTFRATLLIKTSSARIGALLFYEWLLTKNYTECQKDVL